MYTADSVIDLDELVLMCRNDNARSYITEAISCYKIGAYRQSIVAAWIALVYDYVHKLKELELSGDLQAKADLADYEKKRAMNDIKGSLEFERNILLNAKTKYELLSEIEYTDMQRIFEDRNRCAHPTMNSSDQPYRPSPELARTHIRNAVEMFLQHPPVQGKAALNRLLGDVDSPFFPSSTKDAENVLKAGVLSRPRDSLVRNLLIVLLKGILQTGLTFNQERRYYAAVKATRKMHQLVADRTLAESLNGIIANTTDSSLHGVLRFIDIVKDCWRYLKPDQEMRLKNYTTNIPAAQIVYVVHALNIPELKREGELNIAQMNAKDIEAIIDQMPFGVPAPIVEKAVEIYCTSKHFEEANNAGSHLIVPLRSQLTRQQIESVIVAAGTNQEIKGSYTRPQVLSSIKSALTIPESEFNNLLGQNNMTEDFRDK